MSPTECMFIGACIGWVGCALCFIFLPSWRVHDIVRLNDEKLVALMQDCGAEWVYRHPEMKDAYSRALQTGMDLAKCAPKGPPHA